MKKTSASATMLNEISSSTNLCKFGKIRNQVYFLVVKKMLGATIAPQIVGSGYAKFASKNYSIRC